VLYLESSQSVKSKRSTIFSEAGLVPSSWADLRQRFLKNSSQNFFEKYVFYAIYEEMLEMSRFSGFRNYYYCTVMVGA
jgi:hypothetical protein